MFYSMIKYCDIANGLGVRTVLFVSGCRNHCRGCFQPQTWNFKYGKLFDESAEQQIMDSLRPDYIRGLTLLGGDPFEPENQRDLLPFVSRIKQIFPNKDIWAFTGYLLDTDLIPGGKCETEVTQELLSYIDVLVDGPFIREQKDMMLKFRGSSNQRVIDMKEYRQSGKVTELLF